MLRYLSPNYVSLDSESERPPNVGQAGYQENIFKMILKVILKKLLFDDIPGGVRDINI